MNKFVKLLSILVAAVCISGGCTSSPKTTVRGGTEIVLTQTPAPPIAAQNTAQDIYLHEENADIYEQLENAFRSDLIIINNYTMAIGYSDAEQIILTRSRYIIKAGLIREYLTQAFSSVCDYLKEKYPDCTVERVENVTFPDWQYLCATLPYASTSQYLLYDILNTTIDVDTQVAGLVTVTFEVQPKDIVEFAEEKANEQVDNVANTYLDIRFTYAYMKAVYNDIGEEISSSVGYYFDPAYIAKLVFPLDSAPTYADTWQQGRSHNTRKHMGTDIRNAEWNNVYSCSDGTVLYKGTSEIPGNYVIIMDSSGFEYHYYHLVEVPQEVEVGDTIVPGQLIGHVGDTGNSDAPHLHISIIEPNGAFVNPYNLMQLLGIRDEAQG